MRGDTVLNWFKFFFLYIHWTERDLIFGEWKIKNRINQKLYDLRAAALWTPYGVVDSMLKTNGLQEISE